MKVFAPSAFRYPAGTGTDYPYGLQDIGNDSLARTLLAAGLVVADDPGDQVNAGDRSTLTPSAAAAVMASYSKMPIYIGTWANLVAGYPAASNAGASALVTDQPVGSLSSWYSTGLYWRPLNGRTVLGRMALPMFILPTPASVSNVGAVVLNGAGLPFSTISKLWVYLPANTVVTASSPAGWYYAEASDATHLTIYNNLFDPTTSTDNSAPTSKTACTTAQTFTGPTGADIPAFQVPVPAGMMGNRGELFKRIVAAYTNSADTKNIKTKFGQAGSLQTYINATPTTTVSYRNDARVFNCGQTGLQGSVISVGDGASASATGGMTTVDTTLDTVAQVSIQLSANANNSVLGLMLADFEFIG